MEVYAVIVVGNKPSAQAEGFAVAYYVYSLLGEHLGTFFTPAYTLGLRGSFGMAFASFSVPAESPAAAVVGGEKQWQIYLEEDPAPYPLKTGAGVQWPGPVGSDPTLSH